MAAFRRRYEMSLVLRDRDSWGGYADWFMGPDGYVGDVARDRLHKLVTRIAAVVQGIA